MLSRVLFFSNDDGDITNMLIVPKVNWFPMCQIYMDMMDEKILVLVTSFPFIGPQSPLSDNQPFGLSFVTSDRDIIVDLIWIIMLAMFGFVIVN